MEVTTLEGTRLGGRYMVHGLLGRGGMAEVYEADDERLRRPVAVKVLRPALAANADIRRRFESEGRAAGRLSHPNVVTVYDTGEEDGTPYIVMERLPGETLADRMAAGAVDPVWLRRVAGDVLLALGAAHDAGIIHRDVKPGNILIGADGCAKVADFGIAKTAEAVAGDETATNVLVGTPAYLAPERIEGKAATFRTDLYALGVVLYEALARRKPFAGTTPMAVAHAMHEGPPAAIAEVRPDIDPTLAAVVTRALALAPNDRYASADAMRAALEGEEDLTVVAGAPLAVVTADATLAPTAIVEHTIALPPVVAEPRFGRGRRRAVAVLVTGLFVVLLVVALLLGLTAGSGDKQVNHPNGGATTTSTPAPTVTTVTPVTAEPATTLSTPAPKPGPDKNKGHGKKDG